MSEGTRRVFLSTSGLGAAAVGVAALTPALRSAPGTTDEDAAARPDLSELTGSLVAFVSDVRAGAVSVMVGEHEVVVEDHELVARLLRAVAK